MKASSWVSTASVVAVAIAAVSATLVVTHSNVEQGGKQAVVNPKTVVQAPPLVAKAPAANGALASARIAMGAAPACRNCGVVQTVVAKQDKAQGETVGYLMEIKMDDGRLRTVEHRGALPAGSRVLVEGESVRLMPTPKG